MELCECFSYRVEYLRPLLGSEIPHAVVSNGAALDVCVGGGGRGD